MDRSYFSTKSIRSEMPPHFRGSGLYAIDIKITPQ